MAPVVRPLAPHQKAFSRKLSDLKGPRLEEPALHEPVHRDQSVTRIPDCNDIASALGNEIPRQMALECPRLAKLGGVEIEAEGVGRLDPRHDARDIVEVQIAASAQCVHDLLEPGRPALRVGRDQDVRRLRLECEPPLDAPCFEHPRQALGKLLDGRRASPIELRLHGTSLWPAGPRQGACEPVGPSCQKCS